jgi:hypothetical protein
VNSTKPEHYEDLTRLISALLDGRLSEVERVQLETLLESDARARRLYLHFIDQEVELSCLVAPAAQPAAEEKVVRLVEDVRNGQPARAGGFWRFAAAAVFVLAAAVLAFVVLRRERATGTALPKPSVSPTQPVIVWNEDFEAGMSNGWLGRVVGTGLPTGNAQGVAPAIERWPEGEHHTIRLPESWDRGLFALDEKSTLHVTYRFARGTHVNAFMHVMPAEANSPPSMFQLREPAFPRRSQRWQTVSIPFSKFVRKVRTQEGRMEFAGGPPANGERVASLAFSSPDEIDFVIDRIWVTSTATDGQTKQRNP